MRVEDYQRLKVGDLVRHKRSGSAMVVIEIIKGVPVLARYTSMFNPREWDKIDSDGRVISSDA